MPFFDRGETQSSSAETREEIQAVTDVLDMLHMKAYSQLHFVGKSLGGLILSRFILSQNKFNSPMNHFTILGFLANETKIESLNCKLHIIQGSEDPYGSEQDIRKSLSIAGNKNYSLDVIRGADHSYRNVDKEPQYQLEAINKIII